MSDKITSGTVSVFSKKIFIDQNTKKGYLEVINAMAPYMESLSSQFTFKGYERNDMRQTLSAICVDGINRFVFEKGVKLSTFLFLHLRNRILIILKHETARKANATFLNINYYYSHKCGHAFNGKIALDTNCLVCESCNEVGNWERSACFFNEITSYDATIEVPRKEGEDLNTSKDFLPSLNSAISSDKIFFSPAFTIECHDANIDIQLLLARQDNLTRQVAEKLIFDEMSIKEAADSLGISKNIALQKIQKLRKNREFFSYFHS